MLRLLSTHILATLLLGVQYYISISSSSLLQNQKNEHLLVSVAIRLQRSPTTRRQSRQVSQRVSMAARGEDPTTPSQTARQSQRVAQSQRASRQSPNHSKPHPKSKTSQLERRSVWQM